MSAFQVGPEHLGAIVRFALRGGRSTPFWRGHPTNGNDAADMLACLAFECYRSVRYRYPEGDLPGPIAFPDTPVVYDDALSLYRDLTPVQALVALRCYEYQSCEHPEWEASEARALIGRIKDLAISRLPGYDDVDDCWEITETDAEYFTRKRRESREKRNTGTADSLI